MKIALLTTDCREHIKDYARPTPYFGTAPQALLEGFAMLPEASVHVVSCLQRPTVSPEKLASNIWYHPLVVPKLGWLRTGYLGCVHAVRRQLREIQPDIVHGQGTERDCALCAVFSGLPNVLTIHGNMRLVAAINHAGPFSFQRWAARLEAVALPRTNGVVCLTRHTAKAVAALAPRTWVVPNAVETAFFDVQPQPDETPVVLCVGSISPWKNQTALIRALDDQAAVRKLRLVFLGGAGDDPYGREFRSLIATRSWCEHPGFADRSSLKVWLARATALVLPSLEENCPMAILEAVAAGVPVAAARIGGVPDLIEEGVTGLLFDPRDPGATARAVASLLDSASLRADLAGRARQLALTRFHPRAVASRHLEIYREVLAVEKR
jgi:glycosyltransferase involved in cell wall biosynthesis